MSNETPPKTILLIAAHPRGMPTLRLQEEERKIKERLRVAGYGRVPIYSTVAARPIDVQQAMLDFEPQVVHFSGHGAGQAGLALEDEIGNTKLVDSEALGNLFRLFKEKVECAVFNACYSEPQARAVSQHVPCVVGMSQAIEDAAAIVFSVGFYTALGAGRNYKFAYELGCNAIQLAGISESLTPVLIQNKRFSKSVQSSSPQNSILSEEVIPDQNIPTRSQTGQSTSDPYYWVLDRVAEWAQKRSNKGDDPWIDTSSEQFEANNSSNSGENRSKKSPKTYSQKVSEKSKTSGSKRAKQHVEESLRKARLDLARSSKGYSVEENIPLTAGLGLVGRAGLGLGGSWTLAWLLSGPTGGLSFILGLLAPTLTAVSMRNTEMKPMTRTVYYAPISKTEHVEAEIFLNEVEQLLYNNYVLEAASKIEKYQAPKCRRS